MHSFQLWIDTFKNRGKTNLKIVFKDFCSNIFIFCTELALFVLFPFIKDGSTMFFTWKINKWSIQNDLSINKSHKLKKNNNTNSFFITSFFYIDPKLPRMCLYWSKCQLCIQAKCRVFFINMCPSNLNLLFIKELETKVETDWKSI